MIQNYEVSYGPGTVTVHGACVVTSRPYSVTVPAEGWAEYLRPGPERRFVQDIFPDLSADDREFLISGTSPEGWAELYGEEA